MQTRYGVPILMRKQTDRQLRSQRIVAGASPARIAKHDAGVVWPNGAPFKCCYRGFESRRHLQFYLCGVIEAALRSDRSDESRAGASPARGTKH